jgi:hypothetical protein
MRAPPIITTRRDGWTAERQLRFLDTLGRTRSVTTAARAAGMSRVSSYRLRARPAAALFALLWDRAMQPQPARFESHTDTIANGALLRLLGTDFRRNAGISTVSARRRANRANADRTRTS